MGITLEKVRLPVEFQFSEQTDSRFRKVKIWVAHTGENLNNSYFDRKVLEDMSKTLSGVPIVGFLEKVEGTEDDEDFSDHRTEIVVKQDGINIRYAGHAYGFIPEENNSQIEIRNGKEWLTTEGYLWTKFQDAMNIFSDSNGIKSQSMEIDNVEGFVDDLGRIEIESARFSALCILGDHVSPGMSGSTIEFFNKKDQYQFELAEMIKEFELEKGELIVPEDLKEEFEEVVETTAEKVEEKEGDFEEDNDSFKVTNDNNDEEESFKEDDEETEEDEDEEEEDFEKETYSINYELSHDDIRASIHNSLINQFNEEGYVWVSEVYENHAIAEIYDYKNEKSRHINVSYEKDEDSVVLGEYTEMYPMFLTEEEKTTLQNNREKIASLEAELSTLKEFKATSELGKKEELISEFEDDLGKEKAKEIREKIAEFSVEELEKEIALQYFQLKRSEKSEDEVITPSVNNFNKTESENGETAKYGELARLFTK